MAELEPRWRSFSHTCTKHKESGGESHTESTSAKPSHCWPAFPPPGFVGLDRFTTHKSDTLNNEPQPAWFRRVSKQSMLGLFLSHLRHWGGIEEGDGGRVRFCREEDWGLSVFVFVSCCLVMTASSLLKIWTSTRSYFTFLPPLPWLLHLCEPSTATRRLFITKLWCFPSFSQVFQQLHRYILENTSRGDNWNAGTLLLIFFSSSLINAVQYLSLFSQQLMATHSIIIHMMYMHSTVKRDNQPGLLYFLWFPGSSGKTCVFNASTSSQDPWVGLGASCLLAVKLFEMKVNSPCFNSLSK